MVCNKLIVLAAIFFVLAVNEQAIATPLKEVDSCAAVCKTYCYELGMCYKRCDGHFYNPSCECTKCEDGEVQQEVKPKAVRFTISPPRFVKN
ncbi:hypothetical protein M3Y97_01064900 [Aphelenchoides bicaudatus]|nr:hypothetical protein M3Y97_01064900 [Aphelenchoides bicaudatus]